MIIDGGTYKLKIDDSLLLQIKSYRQIGTSDRESGGVLIGRELKDSKIIIVDHMTTPIGRDISTRFSYERRDIGHMVYYDGLNSENQIYLYVGEWHTHPQKVPDPSHKDIVNWMRIWRDDDVYAVQYHLIAGMTKFGIWSYGPNAEEVRLLGKYDWE